jgi:hypothetical protein
MLKKLMTAVLALGFCAQVSASEVAPVVTSEEVNAEVKAIVAEILEGSSVTDASDAMTKIKALAKDKKVQAAVAVVAALVVAELAAIGLVNFAPTKCPKLVKMLVPEKIIKDESLGAYKDACTKEEEIKEDQ